MNDDLVLGIRITAKDGASASVAAVGNALGVVETKSKSAQAALKGMSADLANFSKQTQAQAAAYESLGARLGMTAKAMTDANMAKLTVNNRPLIDSINKTVVDAQAAWSKLSTMGSKQMAGADFANAIRDAAARSSAAMADAADNIDKSNQKIGTSFRGLLPHIRTSLATIGIYFGTQAVAKLIDSVDAYTELNARLKLVSGTTGELTKAQSELFRIAQENRTSFESTVTLYNRMAVSMRDLGRSQDDTLRVVDLLGKAIRISGASATEAEAGLLQLSQALAAGVLNGDEFRSVVENMPRVVKALTEYLHVNIATLREMSAQGKLTGDVVANALLAAGDKLDKEASHIPLTIKGAWEQLSNAMLKFVGESEGVKTVSSEIAAGISGWANILPGVVGLLTKIPGTLVEWDLGGIRAAVAVFTELKEKVEETFGALTKGKGALKVDPELEQLVKVGTPQQMSVDQFAIGKPQVSFFEKQKNEMLEAALAAQKLSEAQKEIARQVFDEANKQGVSAAWALAIAQIESGFTQINKAGEVFSSPKGAMGVMQLMGGTAKRFSVDAKDTADNIKGGVTYLSTLLKMFENNPTLATAAYNAGEGAVLKYNKTVPPYAETQKYVEKAAKIMGEYSAALGVVNGQMENAEQTSGRLGRTTQVLVSEKQKEIAVLEATASAGTAQDQLRITSIENEIKAIRDKAKAEVDLAASMDEKSRIEAAATIAVSELHAQEAEISKNQIGIEEDLAKKKLAILQIEYDAAEGNVLTQNQIKAQMAALEGELTKKVTERAAVEATLARQAKEDGQNEIDLNVKQQQFIQKINDDLKDQLVLLQKLQDAKAAGIGLQGRQVIASSYNAGQDLNAILPQDQVPAVSQKQADLAKARQDIKGLTEDIHQVSDAELRLNQAMEQTVQQARLAADQFRQAFGGIGDAIGTATVSTAQYAHQLYQIARDTRNELDKIDKAGGSKAQMDADKAQLQQTAYNKTMSAQLGIMGELTTAGAKMFGQGSRGYAAMEAAARVFYGIRMALEMKSAVMSLLNIDEQQKMFTQGEMEKTQAAEESTTEVVAQEEIKSQAASETAIANQAEVPIVGFALMAAMAAALAAMGIFKGGAAGGTPAVTAADVAKQQDQSFQNHNATMLGDSSMSTSIKDSLSTIASNSTADLDYSKGMSRNLELISNALAGASAAVAQGFKLNTSGINLGTTSSGKMNPTDPLTSAFFGSTKTTKEVADYGIQFTKQMLTDIVNGGFVKAKEYVDVLVTTKSSALFGLMKSTKQEIDTEYSKLSDPILRAFVDVFRDIYKSMGDAANILGVGGQQFVDQMNTLKTNIGKINLTNDGKKNADQINAAISAQADKWAAQLFPQFKEFQQMGEGMYKTVMRMTAAISSASSKLSQLGVAAQSYETLTTDQKRGDAEAEIVRNSLLAASSLGDVNAILQKLPGTADDLIAAFKNLNEIKIDMSALGQGGIDLTQSMINAAGGIAALKQGLETYMAKFQPAGVAIQAQWANLDQQFRRVGTTMPHTIAEFNQLLTLIDTSTDLGKQEYAGLMGLADAFSKLIDQIDQAQKAYENAIYTPGAQMVSSWTSLTNQFAKLGLAVPKTKLAFQQLAESIDQTTPEGQALYQTLIALAPAFGQFADKLASSEQAYQSSFYSAAEQSALAWADMTNQFKALGVAMPKTKDEFRKLVESIDRATPAGQALYLQLMDLAPAFAKLFDAAAQAVTAAQAKVDSAKSALLSAYKTESSAIQQTIDKLKAFSVSLRNFIAGLNVGAASPGSPESRYQAAMQQYRDTLALAKGGDANAQAQIQTVAQAFIDTSKMYNASSVQYAKDFAEVQQGLSDLADTADQQVSAAQAQLNALTQQVSLLIDINQGVVTVAQAIRDLAAAQAELASARAAPGGGGNAGAGGLPGGMQYVTGPDNGPGPGWSYVTLNGQQGVTPSSPNTPGYGTFYPSHAEGGLAVPGLALVGESGPELVNFTRPGQVLTAAQTRSVLSGGDTAVKLDGLQNAVGVGVKVDQAGYKAMIQVLTSIDRRLQSVESANKLAAVKA